MIDFIGLGAQKAGTSWIYACLWEHPDICIPKKEIHFFSRDRNFGKGLSWYRDHFAECDAKSVTGEFCTSYLTSEQAGKRIRLHCPDARLIAILRNPVERAYSSYLNDLRGGRIERDMTFEEALGSHNHYLEDGCYHRHLRQYSSYRKKGKLLLLVYEDSKEEAGEYIRSIFEYLGVDSDFVPSMLHEVVNPSRDARWPWLDSAIDWSAQKLRELGLTGLVWLIKRSGIRRRLSRLNTRHSGLSRFAPEVRCRLQEYFAKEVGKVEELLGRDLTACWYDYRSYL